MKAFINENNHEQNLNIGDKVMLIKDHNVNQVVDDTSKDWSEWTKIDYSWVDVNDLIKGETYFDPKTGDKFIFNRYETTDKSTFAVDTDGVIHIPQKFRNYDNG